MRKAKSTHDLIRSGKHRKSKPRVLIVCEGENTEPAYLNGLIYELRLSAVNNIVVVGKGADPSAILKEAEKRCDREKKSGDSFDCVYCVFDRDEHTRFVSVRQKINHMKPYKGAKFHHIISIPCIEFWLLLHFKKTTAEYKNCDELVANQFRDIPELKNFNSKNTYDVKNFFDRFKSRVFIAINHSKQIKKEVDANGATGPYTEMHELVESLISISEKDPKQLERSWKCV